MQNAFVKCGSLNFVQRHLDNYMHLAAAKHAILFQYLSGLKTGFAKLKTQQIRWDRFKEHNDSLSLYSKQLWCWIVIKSLTTIVESRHLIFSWYHRLVLTLAHLSPNGNLAVVLLKATFPNPFIAYSSLSPSDFHSMNDHGSNVEYMQTNSPTTHKTWFWPNHNGKCHGTAEEKPGMAYSGETVSRLHSRHVLYDEWHFPFLSWCGSDRRFIFGRETTETEGDRWGTCSKGIQWRNTV